MTYTGWCTSHGQAAMESQKQSSSGAKAEANISRVLCPAHPCCFPLHAVQFLDSIDVAAALALCLPEA